MTLSGKVRLIAPRKLLYVDVSSARGKHRQVCSDSLAENLSAMVATDEAGMQRS